MATWEAGAPLRVEESVTRQERVRFGADRKGTRSERETKKDAALSCRQQKKGRKTGKEQKRRSGSGRSRSKEARSKKAMGEEAEAEAEAEMRLVWTRKTRTAGMEAVQLVFWNPPSPKSAIRDSLQALSSGLPSSLWAGGDRPLAGPRAGNWLRPQYFAQHARGRGGRGTPNIAQ